MEEQTQNQNATDGAVNETPGAVKTFDDILKESDYQAEFDRRMTKGINTAIAKREAELRRQWELEQDEKLSEAQKLAKMSETQKLEYELKKAKREKEDSDAKLNAYMLKDQTLKIAEEKGLPSSLVGLLDFNKLRAEDVETKIDELNETFKKALETALNEKLKEPNPTTKTSTGEKPKREIPALI